LFAANLLVRSGVPQAASEGLGAGKCWRFARSWDECPREAPAIRVTWH